MTRQRLGDGPGAHDADSALDDGLDRALAMAVSGGHHRLALHAAPALLDRLPDGGQDVCETFRQRTGCSLELCPEPGFAGDRVETRPA